jgi:DNA adenine methylase
MSTTPFLKWVGGKGGLLPQLYPLLPPDVQERRHVELFMGGAAFFFARRPRHAILADTNPRLTATFMAVRDSVEGVIANLEELARRHAEDSKSAYYAARDRFNDMVRVPSADLAAHFIYLNKTCFNGLYRENRAGEFNTPIGSYKNPTICDHAALRRASNALAGVTISNAPFEVVAEHCGPRDFVYLDPPYDPISPTAAFTAYAAGGFGRDDQARLARVFRWLDDRGARVMLSNSDTPFIRELYADFRIDTIHARRAINSDADKRGPVPEVVVRNY